MKRMLCFITLFCCGCEQQPLPVQRFLTTSKQGVALDTKTGKECISGLDADFAWSASWPLCSDLAANDEVRKSNLSAAKGLTVAQRGHLNQYGHYEGEMVTLKSGKTIFLKQVYPDGSFDIQDGLEPNPPKETAGVQIPDYKYTAVNASGNRIGSHDRVTWYDLQTGKPVH